MTGGELEKFLDWKLKSEQSGFTTVKPKSVWYTMNTLKLRKKMFKKNSCQISLKCFCWSLCNRKNPRETMCSTSVTVFRKTEQRICFTAWKVRCSCSRIFCFWFSVFWLVRGTFSISRLVTRWLRTYRLIRCWFHLQPNKLHHPPNSSHHNMQQISAHSLV
jgi:hypothetical protein